MKLFMGMLVHLVNCYPGGRVQDSDSAIDCFNAEGEHCLALRKNGGGQWDDVSESMGLPHRFSLSPIPKDARLYKSIDGKLAKVQDYHSRAQGIAKFCDKLGRVMSCEELSKKGFSFDHEQRLLKAANPYSAPAPQAPAEQD